MPALRDTATLLRADLVRWRTEYGSYLYVIHPGCLAVVIYRLAHGLAGLGPLGRLLSRALSLVNIIVTGADYHALAEIGPGFYVPHPQTTLIGAGVRAGANLTVYAGVILGRGSDDAFPIVGDDVRFWTKSTAIGGVHIGDGAEIGAHALVIRDVSAGHVALGVPAVSRPRRSAPR